MVDKKAIKRKIKKQVRQFFHRLTFAMPGGGRLLRLLASSKEHRRFKRKGFADMSGPKEVFQHYYEANTWRNEESLSGSGSTLKYTENIRKEIPRLVEELGVKVILDAPCGDYNWFRMIEWQTPISYIGGDIVDPLIERNNSLYETDGVTFISLDIVNDVLPKADLWLCRDCLFHLSERDLFLALYNFVKSDIKYILTSNHPKCYLNCDIPTGSFRQLNLQITPYNLGKPIQVMDDWVEDHLVRHLALWDRETVKAALASNMEFRRVTGITDELSFK